MKELTGLRTQRLSVVVLNEDTKEWEEVNVPYTSTLTVPKVRRFAEELRMRDPENMATAVRITTTTEPV